MLLKKIFELKVILNDLVSSPLDVMEKWAAWVLSRFRVAMGLLQEIHAVLRSSKATFKSNLSNFESIEALESNGNALDRLIPDIDRALPLLLVVVLGLAIDEDSGYLSILAKELVLPHSALLSVLFGKTDDVQQVRDDHPELLEAH